MGKNAKKTPESEKSRGAGAGEHAAARALLLAAVAVSLGFLGGIRYQQARVTRPLSPAAPRLPLGLPLDQPVRQAPARFAPDTCLPEGKEYLACGPIDLATFSPGRDLVRFDDARVWFESDHASEHEDDDHTIHRRVEEPLRRLVELAARRRAHIKIHDAYRPVGVHLERSLHREGRALDLTSDEISLEELAKLCWQAGFDWVFFELKVKTGAHVHASVKRAVTAASAGGMPTAAPTNATNEAVE